MFVAGFICTECTHRYTTEMEYERRDFVITGVHIDDLLVRCPHNPNHVEYYVTDDVWASGYFSENRSEYEW